LQTLELLHAPVM